ncbi:hypothetical protein GGR88_001025 [Sphingomonas jejuensis]|uniref:Uncharacterized protein n=1 Tax=Sphingomonas jejuensis TaxID=904715 RepID=A0ABX0XJN4_9SPHN|nr:hypothetical protein [Sphingomonas jejuensis]NJC33551.1 hypothetical protein [Sphingomonas jejuensis]
MRGGALALLLMPAALPAQTAESLQQNHDRMTRAEGCRQERAGDVVVCARRDDDAFRLPAQERRPPQEEAGVRSMDAHMALAGAAPGSRDQCGIFADQRRCSKADMIASGWGGGRDPLTAVGRLIGIVDAAEPPALPEGTAGPP